MAQEKELFWLLSSAFEDEYADVFLYLKEADLFKKKIVNGERLADLFEGFSAQELRHADRLAMKMLEMGRSPAWSFRLLPVKSSLNEALRDHVARETNCFHLYNEILKVNDDPDFELIIKGIRDNEKEHLDKCVDILKKLEHRK